MRGTPHVHSLVCIKHDGLSATSAESHDAQEQQSLKDLIKNTITAKLIERHASDNNELPANPTENDNSRNQKSLYNWSPLPQYLIDAEDPRREAFNPLLNYTRNTNGQFNDIRVQILARRLQLANQIHNCCFTCFKYCKDNEQICRFCFPWPEGQHSSSIDVTILKDRDKKQRVRLRVIPERNNAHVNATFFSPIINCAHGGNSDIQFIVNTHGAAEYAAGYASKPEAPDQKRLQILFMKSIANLQERDTHDTDRQRLAAAGQAVVGSTQVGAVQANYFILDQKFVIIVVVVIQINIASFRDIANHGF